MDDALWQLFVLVYVVACAALGVWCAARNDTMIDYVDDVYKHKDEVHKELLREHAKAE